MTFEQNSALPKRFVTAVLPWLVGLGALAVYLATMNSWVTLNSVGTVARVSGWLWQPELQQPLVFLVLYPFRFLPEASIPLALNVFNAVLAALVVVLLARTVALLPHDRTPDQRELEEDANGIFSARTAWIPPVFAAAVLGLQISFWENATAITGEMIDAFVVAYVIRCLLEFRIDERQSWLSRAALLYAAGMTNNWALVGLAPVFLIALIWLKGLQFFNARFIVRMTLWGMAGLLLYLVLPLVQSRATIAPVDFWPGLKSNLSSQKIILAGIYGFLKDNYRVVVVAATSLLPLFIIAMRWRSSFGDNSPLGVFIAKAVFHFVHGLFMAVCLLVVLSPPYSPRQLLPGLPFLTHYYFGAIAIGYCAGYFLLICGVAFRARRMNPVLKLIRYGGFGLIIALLVIVPVTLVRRNLETVQLANGRLVEDLARNLERDLPKPPCAILSDNLGQLALLRAHLQKEGRAKDYLLFDTQSAKWTDYHAFQKHQQPALWPGTFATVTNRSEISPMGLIFFVRELVLKQPVYYLQPSFGYYFEPFEMIPKGMIYQLAAYPSNALLRTAFPAGLVESNEAFWTDFDATSLPLLKKVIPNEDAPRKRDWQSALMKRLHLSDERSLAVEAMARFYSRASTYWAVELQRIGKWDEATNHLDRALALNPDNVAAQVTLEFNRARRRDGSSPPAPTTWSVNDFQEQKLTRVINDCGPFDDPQFTFEQANTYLKGGLNRQALQQIQRVVQLQPTNYVANIWLADLYSLLGQPTEALRIAQNIRANAKAFALVSVRELDLARVEATAHIKLNEGEKAKEVFSKVMALPEADNQYRGMAAQLFLQAGMNAEALPLLERMIADNPADIGALGNRGYAYLQLGQFEAAKGSLTKALELDPKNGIIRLNRAITQLRAKEFDAAKEDYDLLLKDYPDAYQVHFGLGEIAAAKGDTAGSIGQFEICLKIAPAGTPDFLQVSNRLAEVRAQKK